MCCGCGGREAAAPSVSDVVRKHALHSQIPPGGQVFHGAKTSNLQEQLHPVDWEQEDAISSGPTAAPPTPGLARFPAEALLGSAASPTGRCLRQAVQQSHVRKPTSQKDDVTPGHVLGEEVPACETRGGRSSGGPGVPTGRTRPPARAHLSA